MMNRTTAFDSNSVILSRPGDRVVMFHRKTTQFSEDRFLVPEAPALMKIEKTEVKMFDDDKKKKQNEDSDEDNEAREEGGDRWQKEDETWPENLPKGEYHDDEDPAHDFMIEEFKQFYEPKHIEEGEHEESEEEEEKKEEEE